MSKKRKTFTDADMENMIGLYQSGTDIKTLAIRFDAYAPIISREMKLRGIEIKNRLPSHEKQLEILNYYKSGKSFAQIKRDFNVGWFLMNKILDLHDEKRRVWKKHTIDEKYFDRIDSPQKAYYIGLIMADGTVMWNRPKTKINQMSIGLQKEDDYILSKMIKDFKYSGQIKTRAKDKHRNKKPFSTVLISNELFVSKLSKYGMFPNKSITHGFFQNIPKEFIKYCVLGYFDGDGSVSFSKKENRLAASIISSIPFCEKLVNFLHQNQIPCSMRIRKTKNYKMGECRIKGNRACIKFYRFIYDDESPLSLKRKRSKFENVIKLQGMGQIKNTND